MTSTTIVKNVCGPSNNLVEIFDDDAAETLPETTTCNDGGAPVRPLTRMSVFDRSSTLGTWTLDITDNQDNSNEKTTECSTSGHSS
jgi:hypothetical protein